MEVEYQYDEHGNLIAMRGKATAREIVGRRGISPLSSFRFNHRSGGRVLFPDQYLYHLFYV